MEDLNKLTKSHGWPVHTLFFQAFDVAEEHLGIPPQMSASEMAAKVVPDTLMIVSYVSQYHEVFKNETPGNVRGIWEFKIWQRQPQQQRLKSMIWLVEWKKYNRAVRAARFLVQGFDIVCQTTTWNFHIWGSDENASSQQ